MRYGPSGKKRKTNAWKTKKNTIIAHQQGRHKPSLQEQQRLQQIKEHNEMYPSYKGPNAGNTLVADDSYKKEASKNFTVAIGYNKGAYQVIPNNEIKHIGK